MVALKSKQPRMTREQIESSNAIEWLTEKEAATYIQYSVYALRNWRLTDVEDRPPSHKVGPGPKGRIRYAKHELNEWLARPRRGF